jgi:hypothetical protein
LTPSQGGNGPSQYGGFVGSNPTVCTKFNNTEAQVKKVLLVLGLVALSANAEVDPNWKDFSARYQTSNHKVSKVTLEHRVVNDVQAACNAERKRLGKGPYNYAVDACTFWNHKITGNTCVIITGTTTSQNELGHELRHCLQGNFH